jgi:hypothetical protein
MARLERERVVRQVIPEAASRGMLSDGVLVADYYTAEPSPGKWVAVGTVTFWLGRRGEGFPQWMLVGVGSSEQAAVAELRSRMNQTDPPRWKMKCDPSAQPAVESDDRVKTRSADRYVVPWDLQINDAESGASIDSNAMAIT